MHQEHAHDISCISYDYDNGNCYRNIAFFYCEERVRGMEPEGGLGGKQDLCICTYRDMHMYIIILG